MAGPSDTTAEIIEGEDISKAFARIEDELLASMMRNLERHTVDEAAEGFQWTQWQAYQIAELERYARANGLRYGPEFDRLNSKMEEAIRKAYESGRSEAEADMLLFARFMEDEGAPDPGRAQGFLRMPKERMDALVRATHDDMMRAEYATLRKAEDIYRRTIFDAQVYATSGAGTYAKAIDMATHDLIARGVNGIRYRNGSWHGIEEYSRMAVRTATKRAAMVAEGDARKDWGVHTIFVNYRVDACPECMEWMGRVLIDDVYGGGTAEESKSTGYPLLSDAMAQGLFHPNCRDTSSTYFEGVSELPEKPTKREKIRGMIRESYENDLDRAEDDAERYRRLEHFSLDMEDRRHYAELADDADQRASSAMKALSVRDDTLIRVTEHLESEGFPLRDAAEAAGQVADAPDNVREVFMKYLPDMKFNSLHYGGTAHYDPAKRAVNISIASVKAGREWAPPWNVLFHELGHLIDDVAVPRASWNDSGWISMVRGLGESVKKEGKALAFRIKRENGFDTVKRAWARIAHDLLDGFVQTPYAYGDVGDLMGGASGGSFMASGLPGHSGTYYRGSEGLLNLGTEAFAEFFSASIDNPQSLVKLKEYFPDSYRLFEEILEELANG